jgi:hypothetical protein
MTAWMEWEVEPSVSLMNSRVSLAARRVYRAHPHTVTTLLTYCSQELMRWRMRRVCPMRKVGLFLAVNYLGKRKVLGVFSLFSLPGIFKAMWVSCCGAVLGRASVVAFEMLVAKYFRVVTRFI